MEATDWIPRILVVDDNFAIHHDFRKILLPSEQDDSVSATRLNNIKNSLFQEENNANLKLPLYKLDFASQGEEALKLVKNESDNPYAVAFVDIRMPPGWDGVETIQQIWRVDPYIQMVICTAYSDYSWDETIKKLGESENLLILKKPFDVIEVRQLAYSLSRKWKIQSQLDVHMTGLENLVTKRTAALETSLALIRSTLESTADGILVVDVSGQVVDFNQKFIEMWNIPQTVMQKNNFDSIVEFASNQLKTPKKLISVIKSNYETLNIDSFSEVDLKNGKTFEIYSLPHKVRNIIVGRVWDFRDVSERKKMQDALLKEATTDQLTGLPNRGLFYDRINQAIAEAERNKTFLAIVFLDIDRFKLINDSLGHSMGDYLLRAIARKLSKIVRKADTVSRLGGDEFVLLLTDLHGKEQAQLVANKILSKIASPLEVEDHKFSVTGSIGVSFYPNDGTTVEALIKNADIAMYVSKELGKNTINFYSESMSRKFLTRLTLENDLREGLDRNEIVVFYQPFINLNTSEIVGVEALARWQHPVLGLLQPVEFISLAEETGLICQLGEQVLKIACKQNKKWQIAGYKPIQVSVNISSKQLKSAKFDEILKKILEETGLDSQYLELELTESVIMDNTEDVMTIVKKIKNMGISLSMDDFGTGYSSLNYLRHFPFDKLKIDKSFILNAESNSDNANLVKTIIAMAKNLKLNIVAEGMETEEQREFLRKNNCLEAQGFLFSKPINSEHMSDLLKAQQFKKAEQGENHEN
ncbi:MAG TPA: EAL domain-containing protein [Gammaproteobacteria bacterium]|nr:EAL domain-containing protein [Gammaproteobacteria bacterium]